MPIHQMLQGEQHSRVNVQGRPESTLISSPVKTRRKFALDIVCAANLIWSMFVNRFYILASIKGIHLLANEQIFVPGQQGFTT